MFTETDFRTATCLHIVAEALAWYDAGRLPESTAYALGKTVRRLENGEFEGDPIEQAAQLQELWDDTKATL